MPYGIGALIIVVGLVALISGSRNKGSQLFETVTGTKAPTPAPGPDIGGLLGGSLNPFSLLSTPLPAAGVPGPGQGYVPPAGQVYK